jgi:hypothetical protein
VNEEALGVDKEADGVVDKDKRDGKEQQGKCRKDETKMSDVRMDSFHHIAAVEEVGNGGEGSDFLLNTSKTVGMGIGGVQVDFNGSAKGIVSEKTFRIIAQVLNKLVERLLFGDVICGLNKGLSIKLFLYALHFGLRNVILQDNRKGKVFLDKRG